MVDLSGHSFQSSVSMCHPHPSCLPSSQVLTPPTPPTSFSLPHTQWKRREGGSYRCPLPLRRTPQATMAAHPHPSPLCPDPSHRPRLQPLQQVLIILHLSFCCLCVCRGGWVYCQLLVVWLNSVLVLEAVSLFWGLGVSGACGLCIWRAIIIIITILLLPSSPIILLSTCSYWL